MLTVVERMHITVLGAGAMGHGIAQVSAEAGHEVVVRDVDRELVDEGLERIEANLNGAVERDKATPAERDAALDRINGRTSLPEAVKDADLVIEAVPEDMALKQDVFCEIADHAPANAMLATNTSSLSVTELASVLNDASRATGLHFFNPTHIMPLVEIVVAGRTSEETHAVAESYVEDIGKTTIEVTDTPGFASSRLGAMFSLEAIRMAESGVANIEDIDETMRLGYDMPMGLIELVDHTGVDVNIKVLKYLRKELSERFRPPQLLKRKYRAGKLGKKTGEGFYMWEDGEIVGVSDESS